MRVVKSISFNMADPFENKMVLHFSNFPNFSSYVKRLIQRDMEGLSNTTTEMFKKDDSENDEILMKNMLGE